MTTLIVLPNINISFTAKTGPRTRRISAAPNPTKSSRKTFFLRRAFHVFGARFGGLGKNVGGAAKIGDPKSLSDFNTSLFAFARSQPAGQFSKLIMFMTSRTSGTVTNPACK